MTNMYGAINIYAYTISSLVTIIIFFWYPGNIVP